jgi:hypothetical protein
MSFLIADLDTTTKAGKCADVPKRDDNKLSILGSIFDVVRNDGNISEIEGSIDLIHEI